MNDGTVKIGLGAGYGKAGIGAGCDILPDGSLHCGKASLVGGQHGFVDYNDPTAHAISAEASAIAQVAQMGNVRPEIDPEYKPGTLHLNVDTHDFHEVITGETVYVPPDLAAEQEAYYQRKQDKIADARAQAQADADAQAAAIAANNAAAAAPPTPTTEDVKKNVTAAPAVVAEASPAAPAPPTPPTPADATPSPPPAVSVVKTTTDPSSSTTTEVIVDVKIVSPPAQKRTLQEVGADAAAAAPAVVDEPVAAAAPAAGPVDADMAVAADPAAADADVPVVEEEVGAAVAAPVAPVAAPVPEADAAVAVAPVADAGAGAADAADAVVVGDDEIVAADNVVVGAGEVEEVVEEEAEEEAPKEWKRKYDIKKPAPKPKTEEEEEFPGAPTLHTFTGMLPPAIGNPEVVTGTLLIPQTLGVKMWRVAGAKVVVNMTNSILTYEGNEFPVNFEENGVETVTQLVSGIIETDPAYLDTLYFYNVTLTLGQEDNLPKPLPERVVKMKFGSEETLYESILAETKDEDFAKSYPKSDEKFSFETWFIIYGVLDDLTPIKQMQYIHFDLTNAYPIMSTTPAPKLVLKNVAVVIRRLPPLESEYESDTVMLNPVPEVEEEEEEAAAAAVGADVKVVPAAGARKGLRG